MIKTRLSIAFAALALLAIAQGLFTFWATHTAAHHAQRSVVATQMLKHYLELGANKQRLKVWFAQSALAGTAIETEQTALLTKMSGSLAALEKLALTDVDLNRKAQVSSNDQENEFDTLRLLQRNFAVLKTSVLADNFRLASADKPSAWSDLIRIFDRSDGRDIRSVLDQAVVRQREKSNTAQADLEKALSQIQIASVLLALLCSALGAVAVTYFVKRMQNPFKMLIEATTAIAQGNYEQRRADQKNDEFGQIARQLNVVAAKLDKARAQSQTVVQGLEEAVAAKTADVTRSNEALLRVDSRRRQFFAEISHELRSPVTVIRGEAEIALRGANRDAEHYKASLARIVDASVDLSKRVGDLLELAKLDAGSFAIKLESVPLLAVVNTATSQMQAVAASRNIRLGAARWDFNATPENIWINADKDRLHQAMTILLDNAVRYSRPPGNIQIEIQSASQGATVSVIVTDEGIGMTRDELGSAFERHFRGDTARQMQPDGAGLGLSIAKVIANAHGASIELKTRAGGLEGSTQALQGTQAVLTLPVLQHHAPCSNAVPQGMNESEQP